MITLSITVKNRIADWTPNVSLPQIYAGATNVDMVKFTLDSEWNNFTNKKAYLSDGTSLWQVALDAHGCADIPPKISEKPCFMKIGVTGINSSGKTVSSSLLTYQIGKGSSIKSFYGDAAFKSLNEKIDLIMEMRSLGGVESEYYLSDNAAAVSDSAAWSTVSQTPTQNMPYLWHRLKFCYTNGDVDYTEPAVICAKGDKGDKGATGAAGKNGTDGKNGVDASTVTTIQNNVSTAQSNITALQTKTNTLQATVDGMQKIKSLGTGFTLSTSGQLQLSGTVKGIKTGTAVPTTSTISSGYAYFQLES